ncbi:MAG: LPS export ABC transporter periplasmic protein LptC [Alphaproteobacteria bacterium]|nr:LPS export ABC transporter periplasmic protein LptC [Alphaproteobacteria bacterium]
MCKYKRMVQDKRNFIIFEKHRRLTRLWQFLFTGWGLVMVAALAAGAIFTKQLLWTPISAINMVDIASNQFKMTNANFAGTDKNGNPFTIHAKTGRQEYNKPDIIFLDTVSGTTVRQENGKRVTDYIRANHAEYNQTKRNIKLYGNVHIDSSTGDKIQTTEMVIKL